MAEIKKLSRSVKGLTVLVSTHDLHALPDLADEAVLLMNRVLFHGPVAQALEPATLARAFGLDEPSASLAVAVSATLPGAWTTVPEAGLVIETAGSALTVRFTAVLVVVAPSLSVASAVKL